MKQFPFFVFNEISSFNKIKDDYIKEFHKKITDISLMECERYNQVLAQQVAGGNTDLLQQDWTEDQQSVLLFK